MPASPSDTPADSAPRNLNEALRKEFVIKGVGTFTLKRPNAPMQLAIARERGRLLGGSVSTEDWEWSIAHSMALINVTAESKPIGFDWDTIFYEDEDMREFYKSYNEWIGGFRSKPA